MDAKMLLCPVSAVSKHMWFEYEFQQLLINFAHQTINDAVKTIV